MNYKVFFDRASRMSWQGIELAEGQKMPSDYINSTEALYQAFKARFNAEQDAALKALMDQKEKAMD